MQHPIKICPKCEAEFDSPIDQCPDCGVRLLSEDQFDSRFEPLEPAEDLVDVAVDRGAAIEDIARMLNALGIRTYVQLVKADPIGGIARSHFGAWVQPSDVDQAKAEVAKYWQRLGPTKDEHHGVETSNDVSNCPACGDAVPENKDECPSCGLALGGWDAEDTDEDDGEDQGEQDNERTDDR